MRSLAKRERPTILDKQGSDWTAAYVNASPGDERRRCERWRHPEIKDALKRETSAKCAYCEGFVEDVSFPHVEHIRPKSKFPELAHEWSNLTTACERCNVAKGDYYEAGFELLDPYADNVDSHLNAAGAIVDWVKGDTRAEITVARLSLNRSDLVAARARRMLEVRGMLERWHQSSGPLRAALQSAISLDAEEGEFTTTVSAMLRSHGFLT